MTRLPESLRDVDWSLTTWEGARREQLRRWSEMPLESVIQALEEMADLADQFEVGGEPANQGGEAHMDIETRHEPEQSRFATVIEGQVAHLDYAEPSEGVLDYRHTWVPESLRKRGIGERLVLDALDWARSHGYRVIPTCPFVEAVVRRHAEYADLVEKHR